VASEVLEKFDLSQCPLGQDLLAEDIGNLLDSDTFASMNICGSTKINDHRQYLDI
jgi:hypothetical protein